MRRSSPFLVVLLCLSAVSGAWAQTHSRHTQAIPTSEPAEAGQILGRVTDDGGTAVKGASILALGTTLVAARSDQDGYFRLNLTPGDYVLRAACAGYLSTLRARVRVGSDSRVTRDVTLIRIGSSQPSTVRLAGLGSVGPVEALPAGQEEVAAEDASSSHSETAWRLRHLPRTVLRDVGTATWKVEDADRLGLDRRVVTLASARAARGPESGGSALLASPELNGHVDFLTSGSLAASGPSTTPDWPRGVAYVVLGAPLGSSGNWTVRAATTAADAASWTLLGEYRARPDQTHAFRTGASYSSQTPVADGEPHLSIGVASPDTRRVGGAYGFDRWRVNRRLEVDYGLRLDRYDYLAVPNLVSGRAGVRVGVAPGTVFVATVAPHMIAPGAEQFLPPASSGVWLPPERTFSSLEPGRPLDPERVDRYELGLETHVGLGPARTVRILHFNERTADQIATLFGLDDASQVGHYYISSPGAVAVDGWVLGLSGQILDHVSGTVDYTEARAVWDQSPAHQALAVLASSAARAGLERSHDLMTSVDAVVPATATELSVAYRLNSAFSRAGEANPVLAGRFKVEIRQHLPFQPLGRGELHLLISARTMLHEATSSGTFYDELLTVAPPTRLTCGLQMRF